MMSLQRVDRVLGVSQKIDVPRRARHRSIPDAQHQSALQNEALTVFRLRESIQEALESVILKKLLKWAVIRTGLIGKSRVNRRGDISAHTTASR